MALQSVWFFTGLPSDIINSLEKDLENHFDDEMGDSKLINNVLDEYYFTNRATGYPGPGIIPSPTRNFYVTFEYKF